MEKLQTRTRGLVVSVCGVAALCVIGATTAVLANPPHTSCPAVASGWTLVDADTWWDNSVLGFEDEGVSVYETDGVTFTEAFDTFVDSVLGFADGASLEAFVRGEQFDAYDKNQDGLVCMQSIPGVGAVSYLFNGSDNRRNVER